MEDKLRTFLKADPTVAKELGDRIFPDTLPQKATLPALVYQRIDTARISVHREKSSHPKTRIQMRIWAKTKKAARAAADAVREALDGYMGVMGGVTICRAAIVNEIGDYDPETGLRSVLQDYLITYLD